MAPARRSLASVGLARGPLISDWDSSRRSTPAQPECTRRLMWTEFRANGTLVIGGDSTTS